MRRPIATTQPSCAARASSTAASSPHDAPLGLIVPSSLVAPKTLRRFAPQSELPDGITALRFSRAAAAHSSSATRSVARKRGAEAPGHRTPLRRLRPRDGRPISPRSFNLRNMCRSKHRERKRTVSRLKLCSLIRMLVAMAGCQTPESCFLAALLVAGASAPTAETAALGCAKRPMPLVPNMGTGASRCWCHCVPGALHVPDGSRV